MRGRDSGHRGRITSDSFPASIFVINPPAFVLQSFVLFGFSAIGEDLGWRGYGNYVLQRPAARLLLPSVMWALWRLPMTIALSGTSWLVTAQVLLPIFTLSLLSGLVREINGSAWASVILHAAGNTTSIVVLATQALGPVESQPYATMNYCLFPLPLLPYSLGGSDLHTVQHST